MMRNQVPQAHAWKPVAWMWQHEETGMTGFVQHAPEEELRQWERMNKPRKIVRALYSAPPSSLLEQAVKALETAESEMRDWHFEHPARQEIDATLAALREALKGQQ